LPSWDTLVSAHVVLQRYTGRNSEPFLYLISRRDIQVPVLFCPERGSLASFINQRGWIPKKLWAQ